MASVVVSGIVAALHNLFPAIPLSPVDASGGLGAMFDTAQATFGIVDSGSNTNGSYVKFADGTMVCRTPSGAINIATTSGPLQGFYYGVQTWALPASFIDTGYTFTGSYKIANYITMFSQYELNRQTSLLSWVSLSPSNPNGASLVDIVAVGRWK